MSSKALKGHNISAQGNALGPSKKNNKPCKGEIMLKVKSQLDWQYWVNRWDRMQERYIVQRQERFGLMVDVIRQTQAPVQRVVDLGCGVGSLTLTLLEAFPNTEIVGIDYDPTLLYLAAARLAQFGKRVKLVEADLAKDSWIEQITVPVNGIVSATSLHWLTPDELASLYNKLHRILKLGGIFLNADHVGSDTIAIQKKWQEEKEHEFNRPAATNSDDWSGFWQDFAMAFECDIQKIRGKIMGEWRGVEEGLPLTWHFDHLRNAGFGSVDCFWRCGGDAIYGGIK